MPQSVALTQTVAGSPTGPAAQTAVADTGFNSIAWDALPEGDQSLPLGDHLLPATVGKI